MTNGARAAARASIAGRLRAIDWDGVARDLDDGGYARLPAILTPPECRALRTLYDDDRAFRKRVVMEPLRFGRGVYKYFDAPLPPLVTALRSLAYPPLVRVANRWQGALGGARYPASLAGFTRACRARGQTRPTPLLLRYEAGGYNRLHQDLYGDLAFPLQMTFLLSRPGQDFDGGEMLFLENRPREQSIGTAVALGQGEAVVFTVRDRPVRGTHGWKRVTMRHGVSHVTRGRRYTLGVIFHDAR